MIIGSATHAGKTGVDGDDPNSAEIEQLVVTGSLIASDTRDSATPLSTFSYEEINALGASDFKDIVRSMSFNASSLGLSSNNWLGDDGSTGNASINVRNLGNGATLVLLNGKRVIQSSFNENGGAFADIQTLIPSIALAQIDVLKDGASATYGSDAVAGVVNLITRDAFHGLEIETNVSWDHETARQRDHRFQVLYGNSANDIQFTIAASYLDRSELNFADRFNQFGRSGLSSFGQPGRYIPQTASTPPTAVESNYWWPRGGPNASQFAGSLTDLECDKAAMDDGPMGSLGRHPDFPHICVYDYSTFFAIVRPETQSMARASLDWQLEEGRSFYGAVALLDSHSTSDNSFYPDVRYVIVPSHNFGLQLDAARRGFEPVPYQALQRVLGGSADSTFEERPVDTRDHAERSGVDYLLGYESAFEFGGTTWKSDVSVGLSNRKISFARPTDTLTDRMDLAFDGYGGPDCDPANDSRGSGNLGVGKCFYYNSFQTRFYDPVTGEPWMSSNDPWLADPALTVTEAARKHQNPPELLQWLQGDYSSDRSLRHLVFDWVANTDIAEFNLEPIGLAIGTQYKRISAKVDYDDDANRFNYSFLSGDDDWNNRTSSVSMFAETRMWLTNRMELDAALRYESISKPDASSLDPKLSLLVDFHDDLVARMSWGTSFRVGSLQQTGGNRTVFRNSSDPFSNAVSLAYRPSQARGNHDLKPEVAETFNTGFTWRPQAIPGLELSLDWYQYEYNELIIREGHQALIDLDNALRCPNGVNGDPSVGSLCGVWDHDGNGVESVFSIGTGIPDQVIRRADGYLVRTQPKYLNANNLTASGVDIAGSHLFDLGATGNIAISLSVSRYLKYEMQLPAGEVIDGLGKRNATNAIARPMPQMRARLNLGWSREYHAASLGVNYVSGYDDQSIQTAFLGAYIGYADYIESMTTVDAQFRIRAFTLGANRWLGWLAFGANNLLNEAPPLTIVDGAYDYYSHDPRGRMYYVRMNWEYGGDQ